MAPVIPVVTSRFGRLELAEGDVVLCDGGIHGVQGHTIELRANGARWERRIDSLHAQGRPGRGTFVPSPDELARVRAWCDAAWEEAGRPSPAAALGSSSANSGPAPRPPRWVWAVAMRRGDATRVLQGGDEAPAAVRPMLDWLIARVDALAAGR